MKDNLREHERTHTGENPLTEARQAGAQSNPSQNCDTVQSGAIQCEMIKSGARRNDPGAIRCNPLR